METLWKRATPARSPRELAFRPMDWRPVAPAQWAILNESGVILRLIVEPEQYLG
jgi:hypothetical protein